jgi:hypothetical protein
MASNLYSQGFGTTSTASLPGNAVVSDRSPSTTDIKGEMGVFPVGQLWVNSQDESGWQLMAFDSDNGVVSAHWAVLGGSTSDVNTLSGDTGIAMPVGGDIKIAGGAGIVTSASGSTVTVALAGGDIAIDQVTVDASTAPGTNPVKAASDGGITVTGGQVAAGTTANVIRTDSLAANTYTVEIQRSAATASSTVGSNGVSHFNSSHFTVDSNGFVGLSGGGQAVDSLGVDTASAPGTNPVVPTSGGLITITGGQIAAATTANAIRTASLAANTYTVQVQRSKAEAISTVGSNGISHFNSAQFTVDSNGYVELAGGGLAIDSVAVQYGTTPIVPEASGLITINGASIAAGTNPVRTHGTGASTMAVEVQIAQAIAATDATKIGLSNFDSAAFDVDANGFVQLNGGGIAATAFDVQANTAPGTNPVVPTSAGVVTVNGAAVANHSVVLETRSRAVNAYNLEIQYATSSAATDATKSGVAHFDSSQFTVDANGFVALAGGGEAIDSFIPDSGTSPVVPAANGSVTMSGSGSITTVGGTNTLTTQLTGLTNHNVLVGAGTTTITKVAPSATSGIPLVSNGSSADPSFTTAVVAGGGTGNTTFTAYSVICAGTTATGAFQNVSGVGSSGQVLTSTGAGALPTWQSVADIGGWTATSGTFTATASTNYFLTGASTVTLPASPSTGNTVRFAVATASSCVITGNTGQTIRVSSTTSSVAGTATNTANGDCLNLVYNSGTTSWIAVSSMGNWTLA